jgi:hypothetical protein
MALILAYVENPLPSESTVRLNSARTSYSLKGGDSIASFALYLLIKLVTVSKPMPALAGPTRMAVERSTWLRSLLVCAHAQVEAFTDIGHTYVALIHTGSLLKSTSHCYCSVRGARSQHVVQQKNDTVLLQPAVHHSMHRQRSHCHQY